MNRNVDPTFHLLAEQIDAVKLAHNQYPLPTMSDSSQPSIAKPSEPHPESSLPQQPSHPTRYRVYRPSSQAAPALRKDPLLNHYSNAEPLNVSHTTG